MVQIPLDTAKGILVVLKTTKKIYSAILNLPLPKKQRVDVNTAFQEAGKLIDELECSIKEVEQ